MDNETLLRKFNEMFEDITEMDELYMEGKGPGTYAELFRGDFDIIDGLADCIYNKELSKE